MEAQIIFPEMESKGVSESPLQIAGSMEKISGENFSPATFQAASAASGNNFAFLTEDLSSEGKWFSGVPVEQLDFKDVAYSSSPMEAAGEKLQQAPSFLDRLEDFLRSFLSGDKAAPESSVSAEGLSEDGLPDSVTGEGEPLGKPGIDGEFTLSSRLEETPSNQQATPRFGSLQPREIISQVVDKLTLLTAWSRAAHEAAA